MDSIKRLEIVVGQGNMEALAQMWGNSGLTVLDEEYCFPAFVSPPGRDYYLNEANDDDINVHARAGRLGDSFVEFSKAGDPGGAVVYHGRRDCYAATFGDQHFLITLVAESAGLAEHDDGSCESQSLPFGISDDDIAKWAADHARERQELIAWFDGPDYLAALERIRAAGGGDLEGLAYRVRTIPGVDTELFGRVFEATMAALEEQVIEDNTDWPTFTVCHRGLEFVRVLGQGSMEVIRPCLAGVGGEAI